MNKEKLSKADKLRWLFLPALYTIGVWVYTLFTNPKSMTDEFKDSVFSAVFWVMAYVLIVFTVINQVTREPLPVTIMT